ncbi:MAG: hypothetical protein IT318_06515 [Anaerolineales bacterium]|nr:hypothetical protein [Anaerolineales bacterium]
MNVAHDLAAFKHMAAELQDYLLSSTLFWQMQASSDFPKLSLGMLLLTQARLEGADSLLSQTQRAERNATARQVDATLGNWQVAAEKKAAQEFRSRVNLWEQYWNDCREQPVTCADNYPQEVTQRVIAGLLLLKFPRLLDSPEARSLEALDRLARARLVGGRWIWPPDLQPGFPEAEHWYLYGLPASLIG